MTWTPDSAFVISLARRSDRRAQFARNSDRLGFRASFFDALDGQLLDRGAFEGPLGALGCARSHASALASARGVTLVLEDDAVIPKDFQDRMMRLLTQIPKDWLLLTLGTSRRLLPRYVSPDVARLDRFARTHAYLLNGSEAIDAVRRVAASARHHWDVAASEILCPTGRVYGPLHPMVDQAPGASDIATSVVL